MMSLVERAWPCVKILKPNQWVKKGPTAHHYSYVASTYPMSMVHDQVWAIGEKPGSEVAKTFFHLPDLTKSMIPASSRVGESQEESKSLDCSKCERAMSVYQKRVCLDESNRCCASGDLKIFSFPR
jgi:hypothetical protein